MSKFGLDNGRATWHQAGMALQPSLEKDPDDRGPGLLWILLVLVSEALFFLFVFSCLYFYPIHQARLVNTLEF